MKKKSTTTAKPKKKMPAKKIAKAAGSKTKQTFELAAPDADKVMLAGDFTEWDAAPKSMRKLKSGVWKTSINLEKDKKVQYRFLVDGQWVDDPECQDRIPNGFGGENCVRSTTE